MGTLVACSNASDSKSHSRPWSLVSNKKNVMTASYIIVLCHTLLLLNRFEFPNWSFESHLRLFKEKWPIQRSITSLVGRKTANCAQPEENLDTSGEKKWQIQSKKLKPILGKRRGMHGRTKIEPFLWLNPLFVRNLARIFFLYRKLNLDKISYKTLNVHLPKPPKVKFTEFCKCLPSPGPSSGPGTSGLPLTWTGFSLGSEWPDPQVLGLFLSRKDDRHSALHFWRLGFPMPTLIPQFPADG